MKFSATAFSMLALLVSSTLADLHYHAQCDQGRGSSGEINIDVAATHCACGYYRNRHTGGKWWDSCPDCSFDGFTCNSPAKHIGGDEITYYCKKYCGAKGAIS